MKGVPRFHQFPQDRRLFQPGGPIHWQSMNLHLLIAGNGPTGLFPPHRVLAASARLMNESACGLVLVVSEVRAGDVTVKSLESESIAATHGLCAHRHSVPPWKWQKGQPSFMK